MASGQVVGKTLLQRVGATLILAAIILAGTAGGPPARADHLSPESILAGDLWPGNNEASSQTLRESRSPLAGEAPQQAGSLWAGAAWAASATAGTPSPDLPPGIGDWAHTAEADVRLLSAVTAIPPSGSRAATVPLGLHFVLKPGWKIYWRSPGDAGYPPSLDWSGSQNVQGAELSWPVPHRFEAAGIQTVGYKEEVILPLKVALASPGAPLSARLKVDYLICSEVCIPGQVSLTLDLPARSLPAGEEDNNELLASAAAPLMARFQALVPSADPAASGITFSSALLSPRPVAPAGKDAPPRRLRVEAEALPPLTPLADLMVEGSENGQDWHLVAAPPQVRLEKGGRKVIFETVVTGDWSESSPLRLTVTDLQRGGELMARPTEGELPAHELPAPPTSKRTFVTMLGIALAGGLILNLMPCVLPVLSLKVLSLVGHGGRARHEARPVFLASSAGMIAAFVLLGGILALLKQAGAAIGWGIQFQQPLFLVAMIVILLLFAANLWGMFNVRLPGRISDAIASIPVPGTVPGSGDTTDSSPAHPHGSLTGHALTGACATILATPCSAPFLGTAVGFALARGPLEILSIFLALGVGMALPYLGIALFPVLATWLPRPGHWMITLRKVMALALVGSALWLGWVLAGVLEDGPRLTQGDDSSGGTASISWHPFSTDIIAAQVDAGKVVFVDVTADWCITCKVNKAAVLERAPVSLALQAAEIIPLQADWTRPDDRIAAYLSSYGRYGIPFNIVYGPAAPEGIPLPEVLSQSVVMEALARARRPAP